MTHIYASNLQRAVRTAQAIAEAQPSSPGGDESLGVVQVPELREKDFGSDEGKRFGTRGSDKEAAASAVASSSADYVAPESREAMKVRIVRFIDTILVPLVTDVASQVDQGPIVVVAHGIILNVLLSCLLSRFGPDELVKFSRPGDASWRSEWLAAWSNTGYLEAVLQVTTPAADPAPDVSEIVSDQSQNTGPTNSLVEEETALTSSTLSPPTMPVIQMSVKTVNCVDHLQGLKKTRGGIGSAASDSKQRTMDSFFSRPAKKPKTEEGSS